MTNDEHLLKKRLIELSQRSDRRSCYEQTDFLNLTEQTVLQELAFGGKIKNLTMYGGLPEAERQIAVFGNEDTCGYAYTPDIEILRISPLSEKFGEALTHRDYLGAILALGIKRELTGDILIDGQTAYVAVSESITEFIAANLLRIRHTDVICEKITRLPPILQKEPDEQICFVASERLDCLIAAVFHLSRSHAKELFLKERIFINHKLTTDPAAQAAENDMISVRGMGRFRYRGIRKYTKKDRLCVTILLYK